MLVSLLINISAMISIFEMHMQMLYVYILMTIFKLLHFR